MPEDTNRYCLSCTSQSEDDTLQLAERLASVLLPGDILCLSGDLGAGKTTFTRGLVRGIGSPAPVSSPTFTLLHEYAGGRLPVYHADAYRLTGTADALGTGIEEYIQRGDGVLIVEWWERIAELLPEERLEITLAEGEDLEHRKVTLQGRGSRWKVLEGLKDAKC
ncbi:MAG: tRNA (adenosine(37)-N6)-threonylcarbamoyltransferase complex ATPase subunit type 1 TsaE [Armatimonadaceae bacterium]